MIVASRTERTIVLEMGQDASATSPVLDEALDLAERLANAVEQGRVDLGDLGRRARRVLQKTAGTPEAEQLFSRRMGEVVEFRRRFIEDNALAAQIDV